MRRWSQSALGSSKAARVLRHSTSEVANVPHVPRWLLLRAWHRATLLRLSQQQTETHSPAPVSVEYASAMGALVEFHAALVRSELCDVRDDELAAVLLSSSADLLAQGTLAPAAVERMLEVFYPVWQPRLRAICTEMALRQERTMEASSELPAKTLAAWKARTAIVSCASACSSATGEALLRSAAQLEVTAAIESLDALQLDSVALQVDDAAADALVVCVENVRRAAEAVAELQTTGDADLTLIGLTAWRATVVLLEPMALAASLHQVVTDSVASLLRAVAGQFCGDAIAARKSMAPVYGCLAANALARAGAGDAAECRLMSFDLLLAAHPPPPTSTEMPALLQIINETLQLRPPDEVLEHMRSVVALAVTAGVEDAEPSVVAACVAAIVEVHRAAEPRGDNSAPAAGVGIELASALRSIDHVVCGRIVAGSMPLSVALDVLAAFAFANFADAGAFACVIEQLTAPSPVTSIASADHDLDFLPPLPTSAAGATCVSVAPRAAVEPVLASKLLFALAKVQHPRRFEVEAALQSSQAAPPQVQPAQERGRRRGLRAVSRPAV
jgi:hypothetical protein